MDTNQFKLKVIADEISSCKSCELCNNRTNTVPGAGNIKAKLVCLGEAPGMAEDQQGLPFVGRSGKLLTNMLKSIDCEREDVFICNICKCRPPNNRKPLPEEMNACLPFLHRQLEIIQPKVIITLGATATEGLLGPGLGITKRRGSWEKYKGIHVMPSLHPAALLRNPSWKKDAWNDFQMVKQFLENN